MKKPILLVLILAAALGCGVKNPKETFGKRKFIEDFDIFKDIFEQANSGLYKYHSKEKVDSMFASNRRQIKNSTNFRAFYNLVNNVMDFTGSSHNSLLPDGATDQAISARQIFFPFSIKYLNGKIYANIAYENIPLGSEIISVNGISATEFTEKLSKYPSTDGHNKTGKYAFLQTDWMPYFVYMAYGAIDRFDIEFKDGKVTQSVSLNPVTYSNFYENNANRFIPHYERHDQDYSFRKLDATTALLKVSTFGMGGPASDGHKEYASFLDSIFTKLQQASTKNLIVDVRGNGGGNDPNDILLYSYLTKRNFRENQWAFVLVNDRVPLSQYFIGDEEEIKEGLKELKKEHSVVKDGKYYQNENYNKIWNPNPKAFQGDIYLLIDPFVASAGSLFASLVKSDEHSTVIGQETLGGYYGHTGHVPVTYQLPNTKLYVNFSIVDLQQDVRELPDQKFGDGVKPHYNIEPTIETYLKNKDTVLEFTKSLIEKRSN